MSLWKQKKSVISLKAEEGTCLLFLYSRPKVTNLLNYLVLGIKILPYKIISLWSTKFIVAQSTILNHWNN